MVYELYDEHDIIMVVDHQCIHLDLVGVVSRVRSRCIYLVVDIASVLHMCVKSRSQRCVETLIFHSQI